MEGDVVRLLPARRGHFILESGHHGDLWLDLELLFLRPERVGPLASELAARLARYDVEAVCGPLVEGAYLALTVASELGVTFTKSQPGVRASAREPSFSPKNRRRESTLLSAGLCTKQAFRPNR